MTRRVQVIIGDDLDHYRSRGKEHTDADETVCLAFGTDPDHLRVVELDLTKAHADELRELVDGYLRAGHKPGSQPGPGAMPESGDPVPLRADGSRPREIPGTRIFYKKVRKFADEHEFDYGGDNKNKRYSREMRLAYHTFLARRAEAGDVRADAQLAFGHRLRFWPLELEEHQDA